MKNKTPTRPPQLATKLLRSFLRDDLLEDVGGDLEEQFCKTAKEKSLQRAKRNYWFQVIHYLRPFAFRKINYQLNHFGMFQNYFRIGWRNLTKQKMYSFIKIGGFALGIAACLLIALYINDELSYDRHYKNGDRIYRVYQNYHDDGKDYKGAWFQAPFANALKEDYPEVEMVARYNSGALFGAGANHIRRDSETENMFEENFVYADQDLLELLETPMVYGNRAHCLDEPNTMVITKSKAEKYFPNENPVGKLMVVNNDTKQPYKIGGVIEDFTSHSHIQYDFIITMKGREFWQGEQNYWGAQNYMTYVRLREGASAAELELKMQKVIEKYLMPLWIREGVPNPKTIADKVSFLLQPVKDIHARSGDIQDELQHGDIRFIWLFGAVALFILLLACINFINLSTAKSANRAKEVGLRKTVGSYRGNIINQFLTESLLYSVLSFILALVLAMLLLPYFNALAGKQLEMPFTSMWFVPVLLVSCVVIGVLAGIYPSFYLSAFKPAEVLKGNLSRGSKNSVMRNGLVVFQFTTSIVLIIATIIIYRQMDFILTRHAGFDKDQVVMIHGTNTLPNVRTFKKELKQLAAVKSVSISDYLPVQGTRRNGNGFWEDGKQKTEQSIGAQFWVVDPSYIETMGMKIVEGRDFNENAFLDTANIIINQAMVKKLGLQNPIDKRVANYRGWNVIGVVEDFNYESMRGKVEPLAMIVGISPGIVSVKVQGTDMQSALQQIGEVWKKVSPHQALRYTFMDETFARMYDDVQRMSSIFTSFAILAIVVACLGLFALSAFMVEQRNKEISIRLVLGASLNSIFNLLTLNFVKLVVLSIVIAAPIAWYMMTQWLQDFEYKIPIGWDVFVMAGVMSVLIALLTISYQSIKAALARPVNGLRNE